jgi:hypothetical protein
METNNIKTIKVLYWATLVGFVTHIVVVGLTTFQSLFPSPLLYGEVRLIQIDFMTRVTKNATTFGEVRLFDMTNTHVAIVFNNTSFMNTKAIVLVVLNVIGQLVWLYFTWLLLTIFKSLKSENVFVGANIKRLRLIASVIGISPIIQLIKNMLFADLVGQEIISTDKYVAFNYDYSMFSGVLYMVLILVLVEVFRYGMKLKQEYDLTV